MGTFFLIDSTDSLGSRATFLLLKGSGVATNRNGLYNASSSVEPLRMFNCGTELDMACARGTTRIGTTQPMGGGCTRAQIVMQGHLHGGGYQGVLSWPSYFLRCQGDIRRTHAQMCA